MGVGRSEMPLLGVTQKQGGTTGLNFEKFISYMELYIAVYLYTMVASPPPSSNFAQNYQDNTIKVLDSCSIKMTEKHVKELGNR